MWVGNVLSLSVHRGGSYLSGCSSGDKSGGGGVGRGYLSSAKSDGMSDGRSDGGTSMVLSVVAGPVPSLVGVTLIPGLRAGAGTLVPVLGPEGGTLTKGVSPIFSDFFFLQNNFFLEPGSVGKSGGGGVGGTSLAVTQEDFLVKIDCTKITTINIIGI